MIRLLSILLFFLLIFWLATSAVYAQVEIQDCPRCAKKQVYDEKIIKTPENLTLPIFGKIETKNFSLPALSVIFGLLDGFNPCAMWALIFLISLLLGMKDKKRMWILGSIFILTSAFVYFMFMAAWLNFFLLVGFVVWIRLVVGLFALGAGVYSIRDFVVNKDGGCKISGVPKRRQILEKIRDITKQETFILAIGGIILLAIAVNTIELICSAGFPAIFTNILSLSALPGWQYYLYLLIYIFFFMIDDLFVFIIAMITLQAVGIQTKYARYCRLIGGILMLLIGILLIFKPEVLMFG